MWRSPEGGVEVPDVIAPGAPAAPWSARTPKGVSPAAAGPSGGGGRPPGRRRALPVAVVKRLRKPLEVTTSAPSTPVLFASATAGIARPLPAGGPRAPPGRESVTLEVLVRVTWADLSPLRPLVPRPRVHALAGGA